MDEMVIPDRAQYEDAQRTLQHLWSASTEGLIVLAGWYPEIHPSRPDSSPPVWFTAETYSEAVYSLAHTIVPGVDGPTGVWGIEVEYETGARRWLNPSLITHETEEGCKEPPCTDRQHDLAIRMMLAEKAADADPGRYGGANRRFFRVWREPNGREWVLDVFTDLGESLVVVNPADAQRAEELYAHRVVNQALDDAGLA